MAPPANGSNKPAAKAKPEKELYPMVPWKYDTFLWSMGFLLDAFFREVHPKGAWNVPRHGPVLFVAAPHANQVRALRRALSPFLPSTPCCTWL